MTPTRKGRPSHTIIFTLVGLALAAAFAVGLQARESANGAGRLYGYTMVNGPTSPECGFQYVDLEAKGSVVALERGRADADNDDRAAVIELSQPFELYQTPVRSLVVSGNGYLAVADSLGQDDGTDYSNDCGLPVQADNPRASHNRIYVYHDDLRPQQGGQMRQAYFPSCPRASAAGAPEACTVVEWNRFERVEPIPSSRPLRVQAVMYHASQSVALQYASLDDSQGSQATVGLQGFDGRAATEASCNRGRQVAAGQAVCFFDPRHPPAQRLASRPGRD